MTQERGHLSDAQYQERVRQLEKRRAAQQVADLRELMRQPWGRRVVYSLVFERGNLHGSSFHGQHKDGASNALCTAHAEGKRALAGSWLDEIKQHCMPEYLEMLGEQVTQREAELLIKQQAASEASDDE